MSDDLETRAREIETPMLGHAGLLGRQQIVRVPDVEEDEEVVRAGHTMPPSCMRCLQLGRTCHDAGALGFSGACLGVQRDGSCLVAVVRAAKAAGVEWAFEVVQEGERVWWDYVGEPIPEPKEG